MNKIKIFSIITLSAIMLTSCKGVDQNSVIRSSADIRAEQYHYFDNLFLVVQ